MTYPGYSGSTPTYSSTSGVWTSISGADSMVYSLYDDAGNVDSRVDGRGVTTAYSRSDPGLLLTNVHYTLPSSPPSSLVNTPDVNIAYDNFGRESSIDNGIVKTVYGATTPSVVPGYDDDDNPLNLNISFYEPGTTTIGPLAFINYTYYPDGSEDTMISPSGTSTYTYDAAERMTGLTNPFSESTSWAYGNNDWLASLTDYNSSSGLVTTASYAYNTRGFLTALANTDPSSTTLSQFGGTGSSAMTYDAVGNMLTLPATIATHTAYSGATTCGYDSKDGVRFCTANADCIK
jgi:YD repeat-containing protein